MRRGFTLIELLVVIAVIGVLAGVVMVSFRGTRESAALAGARSFASSLENRVGADVVGKWSFEEASGNAVDSSGLSHTGTLVNGPARADNDDLGGKALSLNGSNQYVDMGDPADGHLDFGSGDFTVSIWVKPDVLKDYNVLVSKQNPNRTAFHYTIRFDGSVRIDTGSPTGACGDDITLTNPFAAGVWQHIALVFVRGEGVTVYRNGEYGGKGLSCKQIGANSDSLHVGHGQTSYPGYFDGQIDEVGLYAGAFNTAQAEQLYAESKAQFLSEQ